MDVLSGLLECVLVGVSVGYILGLYLHLRCRDDHSGHFLYESLVLRLEDVLEMFLRLLLLLHAGGQGGHGPVDGVLPVQLGQLLGAVDGHGLSGVQGPGPEGRPRGHLDAPGHSASIIECFF